MEQDLTRLLIETAVRRALRQGEESPEREARNLVDLGVNFSQGRFQTRFLSTIQTMLCDETSAYYALVRDVLAHTNQDRLLTFGVNLGYEGCTKGAKIIRQTEQENGFNVPWALTIQLNERTLNEDPQAYGRVFSQGAELGVRTYLLFAEGGLQALAPLLRDQEKSAFVLCLPPEQVESALSACLEGVPNVMAAVWWEEGAVSACRRLRDAGILYSVLMQCTEQDRGRIFSGSWLEEVLKVHPASAFLLTASGCTEATQHEIYQYVIDVRERQRHPVLLMDLKQDIMRIDRVLSDDVCLAAFDAEGALHTDAGVFRERECNLFQNDLQEIFRRALKKSAKNQSTGFSS